MNDSIQIKIVDSDGDVEFFEVRAEPDIHYSAEEIEGIEEEPTTK
jgi:hypothetical protein